MFYPTMVRLPTNLCSNLIITNLEHLITKHCLIELPLLITEYIGNEHLQFTDNESMPIIFMLKREAKWMRVFESQ